MVSQIIQKVARILTSLNPPDQATFSVGGAAAIPSGPHSQHLAVPETRRDTFALPFAA